MINRNFTSFPVLTTERLTLRQLSMDDRQHVFALRSNTAINQYLDREASKTIEDAIHFINKINDSIQKNDALYWAITLTKAKIFVGTICLYNFSNEKNACEIGYELLINFQGQGIMKEAAEKVIDYVFQTMQVQKVEVFTHVGNRNSTKLLEKLGFVKLIEADKKNEDLSMFTLMNLLDKK